MSHAERPRSRPSSTARRRIVGTKSRNTRGVRGCGEQGKVDRRNHSQHKRPHPKDATQTQLDHLPLGRNLGDAQQTCLGGDRILKEKRRRGGLPKWRKTDVPHGTVYLVQVVAVCVCVCVGTGGKGMGNGNVYRGRGDTLHCRRPSETHGTPKPRKHHSG